MLRRHPRLLSLAIVVAAVTATTGLTACEPPPDTYVALGDSYVSGPGIPIPSTNPLGCMRSSKNYPNLVRSRIKVTKFTDVSCSGADTQDMHTPQSVTPGPANPPQLNALNRQTKVVTLGIGGNDIGFTDIAINCGNPFGGGCKSDYVHDGQDELSEAIAATGPKVATVLTEIKRRAPRAKAFVVGYPTVLPETGDGCSPLVPINAEDVAYLREKFKELNAMLKSRAEAAAITYVDAATPSIGHDFCQSVGTKWVEGIVPSSTAYPVHPNAAGMAGTANTVGTRINQLVTS